MSATLDEILNIGWPHRGGWRTYGDEVLAAGDGGPIPTAEEIEAARPAADAALAAAAEVQAKLAARAAGRSALREAWDALPPFIRGPYRTHFEAVNSLLDEGDNEGAIALIEFAQPVATFRSEQMATFEAVQAQMKAGIEAL